MGIHDGGNEVGGTGARGGDADAHPPGNHGVALRGVAGSLFVTDQNVVHFGGHQGVIGGQDRATGQTENIVDAEFFERADNSLRAGHHRWGYNVVRPKDRRGGRSSVDTGFCRLVDAFRSFGSSGLCSHQRGADGRSFAHRTLPYWILNWAVLNLTERAASPENKKTPQPGGFS